MLSPTAENVIAGTIVAAAVAVVGGWIVHQFRVSPFRPPQTLLYGLNIVITRLLWRAEIRGQFELPPGQGAVIVANHRSSIDPAFIAMSVRAVVHWLVAREYCDAPAFRWFLRTCEAIPTSRSGVDTAATKQAIRLVAEGGLVGVLPEGRINTTPATLLPGRPGAVLIALKARAPIIPCFIDGAPYDGTAAGALLMPTRVRMTVGRPIDLSAYYGREHERAVLAELTLRVLAEMARLAGDNAFVPQLAGRFYKPA